jgi:hypothetical protein
VNFIKYLPFYSDGARPVFREVKRFELEIPLVNIELRPESRPESKLATGQVAGQVTGQVLSLLIKVQGEMNRAELMKALKLKGRDNFLKKYLNPALELGLVEMTNPDSPKSPMQKYRLTVNGRNALKDGADFMSEKEDKDANIY